MNRWVVSVPVWGHFHTRTFIDGSLPCQLAEGNLEALAPDGIDYIIHTINPFWGDNLGQLAQLANIDFRPVHHHPSQWESLNRCHAEAIRIANGRPVIFIPPDCFISANALKAVKARYDEGKKAISTVCLRLDPDAGLPAPMPPRQLIQWAIDFPHKISTLCLWGWGTRTSVPSINLFPAPCGLVARAYHLHPLMLSIPAGTHFIGTIDDDLVANIHPDDMHVVTDTDELAMMEVSPSERTIGEESEPLDVGYVLKFARERCNDMHKHFFNQRIVMRARDGSSDAEDQTLFPILRV